MSATSSWGVGTVSVAKFHQGLRTGGITRTKEAAPQPGLARYGANDSQRKN